MGDLVEEAKTPSQHPKTHAHCALDWSDLELVLQLWDEKGNLRLGVALAGGGANTARVNAAHNRDKPLDPTVDRVSIADRPPERRGSTHTTRSGLGGGGGARRASGPTPRTRPTRLVGAQQPKAKRKSRKAG